MLKSEMPGNKISKPYFIAFFVVLCILAVLPVAFRFSSLRKNPAEFNTADKNYLTMEVKAMSVSPTMSAHVGVGDYMVDQNGEENMRIVSIIKQMPTIVYKTSFDNGGSYVNYITDQIDIYLLVKARYNKSGEALFLTPTTTELMMGMLLPAVFCDAARTKRYALNLEIIKVNKP